MTDISKYFYTSRLISAELSESLSKFFNENTGTAIGFEFQSQMQEWLSIAKDIEQYDGKFSFENYIWFILSNDGKKDSVIPRKEYFEMRRQRKKYFVTSIKKEKDNKFADGILAQNAESYFFLMKSDPNLKKYSSKNEYCEEKYLSVLAWGKDIKSDLVDYPYILQISPKRAAKCFMYDCAFRVYDLISHDYYGDIENGIVSKFPPFMNSGIFSLQSKENELKYEVNEDSVQVFDEITYEKENGDSQTIRTVTDTIQGKFSDVSDEGSETALINSLVNQGKISLHNNVLDSTDKSLFGMIYSSFNVEDINRGSKKINLMQLVKSVYSGNPRRTNYMQVIDHLERMKHYRIEMTTTNSSGKFVRGGSITFFDLMYQIPQNADTDESLYSEFSITDGKTQESFLDAIKECPDLSSIEIDVMPSKYIKDAMRSNMNYSILTRLYSKDMPVKVKSMLILLTSERTDIYPNSNCTLPYEFFIEKLRMDNLKKSVLVKQIKEMLGYLKDNEILISDYETSTYTVNISFIPISDTERALYKLDYKDKAE